MGLPMWRTPSPVRLDPDPLKRIELRCHVNTHRRNQRSLAGSHHLRSLQRYLANSADPALSLLTATRHRETDESNGSSPSSPPSAMSPLGAPSSSSSLLEMLQAQNLAVMGRESGNVPSHGSRGYSWWRSHRADLESRLSGMFESEDNWNSSIHARSGADDAFDISSSPLNDDSLDTSASPAEDSNMMGDYNEESTQSTVGIEDLFNDNASMVSYGSSTPNSSRPYQSRQELLPWLSEESVRSQHSSGRRAGGSAGYNPQRLGPRPTSAVSFDDIASRRLLRRRRRHPSVLRDQNGNFQGTADQFEDSGETSAPLGGSLRRTPTFYYPSTSSLNAGVVDGLGDRNRSPSPVGAQESALEGPVQAEGIVSSNASIACEPGDDFSTVDSLEVTEGASDINNVR
ncbi:hypothetical protein POJ06DRAFT_251634 [Lipomyces tetrasporus]|uniref:Uncharacterized protein n=1 Tax=Lipomyces tetrasporus TaxID=54092 RepID=A0AAD7QUD9_9ASCO|nr:uncharacterized protein POJ06DRAFT_251634 [Lipomyces tetrasporus]KAJ8101478.1 hypothetical protein POJ06DRAFT_251634 [Lipomyces tetrasporus]